LEKNYDASPGPSKYFISLLVEFLEKKEQPSSQKKSRFTEELINAYQAYGPDENSVFYPVIQKYMDTTRVKATHIYPFALGTTVIAMLFGESSVEGLFGARNDLILADFS
jgi:hypothetical protein